MSFDTPAGTRGGRMPAPGGPVGRWVQRRMMSQHRGTWKFMGMDLLFLTTVGRKSGAERVSPVAWFPGEDGSWLIVASAAGAAQNPAWYLNLAAHPDRVRIVAAQPRYAKYQEKTDRELPVIRLTRQA